MATDLDAEFRRFVEVFSIDRASADLDWLCSASKQFDIGESCSEISSSIIKQSISDQSPLSMIRLGDGEGNILAGFRAEFPTLSAYSEREILWMMFGGASFSPHQVDRVRADLRAAIVNADILGVSDRARLERMRRRLASGDARLDFRGLAGSLESIVSVRHVVEMSGWRPAALVSNMAHRYLGPCYKSLLSGLDFLGYVAPYDLDALLISSFNVGQVRGYRIPNQASNGQGDGAKWFPELYDALLDQLTVPRRGAVFLVAAGILGKSICHEIKMRGGIGLDVGSMVDVWTGRGVRHYQDAAFIAAHRLDV